jgi:hypothetical protein
MAPAASEAEPPEQAGARMTVPAIEIDNESLQNY